MTEPPLGIVLRPDRLIRERGLEQVSVTTPYGPVDRLYVGDLDGGRAAFLYGRFAGTRTPSWDIDYRQNQAAFDALGVRDLVGTFLCGALSEEYRAGDMVIPDDLIGVGPFRHTMHEGAFRNVHLYEPFCPRLRRALARAAEAAGVAVHDGGTYVCFHGYPRIETRAELALYSSWGGSLVGQTLDPEATLARQQRVHYAALAAPIDDVALQRALQADDPARARTVEFEAKRTARERFERIVEVLPRFVAAERDATCGCAAKLEDSVDYFAHRPAWEDG